MSARVTSEATMTRLLFTFASLAITYLGRVADAAVVERDWAEAARR